MNRSKSAATSRAHLTYRLRNADDVALLGALRARLRAYLQQRLVPDTTQRDVILSVHEAAMNSLRCGGGEVDIDVWLRSGRVMASIKDHGPGLSRGRRPLPDTMATSGRGLYLIGHLMDDVIIESSRGTRVNMEKRLPTAGTAARRKPVEPAS